MVASYEKYEEIRDSMGYTDCKVAKDAGIATTTMYGWKKGEYAPKPDKISKIASVLGVDWSRLYVIED